MGAHVVVAARTRDAIEDTAARASERGARAIAVPCDVTVQEQLESLVAATISEFGRIDLLVNNAGGWPPGPALQTTPKELRERNEFSWFPIVEVAYLFAGIFVTMIPVFIILSVLMTLAGRALIKKYSAK